MKKYSVGVRNNKKYAYSMVLQTNFRWIARLCYFLFKPFVNEVDISTTKDIIIKHNEPPFANIYMRSCDMKDECFYIWRGWWQRVGKTIYDVWEGEKYATYFPLDDFEKEEFESIYRHQQCLE